MKHSELTGGKQPESSKVAILPSFSLCIMGHDVTKYFSIAS